MRYESPWPAASGTAAVAPQPSSALARPICVDLDRALLKTNACCESVLLLARQAPWILLLLPWWLLRGRAYFKRRLARHVVPDPASLPYRAEVLDFLRQQRAAGESLVLVSAADERVARAVAAHLGLFDHVIASDGRMDCTGAVRLFAIRNYLGKRGFAYLGGSAADLIVCEAAAETYLAAVGGDVLRRVRTVCMPIVLGTAAGNAKRLAAALKTLRPHQWVKNLLVLVPLFLAHQVDQLAKAGTALAAMAAFCCCASAVYVFNDLLDVEVDRRHPTKHRRPFAAGDLSPAAGLLLAPLLGLAGFALAARFVSLDFCKLLAVYVGLTTAYSLGIKKQLVLDVLLLAGLYTFRMFAGAVAVEVELSQWLLAFSMFFFFSLAIGKRYIELNRRGGAASETLPGRGYRVEDASLLESLGPTSGYLAVLVLCLYIESEQVKTMYDDPWLLWLACPLLLYWITRFWLLAKRRQIADDPVVFALKDKASLCSIALTALVVLLARI
jgi:4-hydroxybenzoate polyprenyltransferase